MNPESRSGLNYSEEIQKNPVERVFYEILGPEAKQKFASLDKAGREQYMKDVKKRADEKKAIMQKREETIQNMPPEDRKVYEESVGVGLEGEELQKAKDLYVDSYQEVTKNKGTEAEEVSSESSPLPEKDGEDVEKAA